MSRPGNPEFCRYREVCIATWREAANQTQDRFHRIRLRRLADQLECMQPHGSYAVKTINLYPEPPRGRRYKFQD